jgi:toxin-antitoxin system PIN domain toxin
VIAVDTNLLVYAHRADARWHEPARSRFKSLAEDPRPWAVPWPCAHEFIGVVTNRKLHTNPTPIALALEQLALWSAAPGFRFLSEGGEHRAILGQLCLKGGVTGGAIHDARIAAICLEHDVNELWTADRDFSRFPALKTRNPLVA